MATYYESAYKQLLMGVSQQDPKDRLDGQLTEQINMTSDPVYGLHRRSPMRFEGNIPVSWDPDNVAVLNTYITGELTWVTVSTAGNIAVVDKSGSLIWAINEPYLQCTSKAAIRFVVLNNGIYIANVEQVPKEEQSEVQKIYIDPKTAGFWAVQAASFNTKYTCRVTFLDDGTVMDTEYKTPANTGDNSAVAIEQTTLEYIANDFVVKYNGVNGLEAAASGNVLAIRSTNGRPISVTSTNPRALVHASTNARVRSVEDLPAQIGVSFMYNFVCAVGTGSKLTYYRYDGVNRLWLEDAKWGDGVRLTNMPVRVIAKSARDWTLEKPNYIPRGAGDASTNPSPKFVENGITGMGTFQGRLILLAREYVCMSATNSPETWFRTTVDALEASDPIEAAGSDSASSAYVYTTVFNKDLVIYGSDIQSIIPGTQPVTPSNVAIGVMARYKCTLYAPPVTAGRSQYMGASRGDGYGAIWEVVPSDYTASQITANDVTRHIPGYVKGTLRVMATSTTSSILAAGFTGDLNTILIEEYLWDGSEKKQSAWHKWNFAKPVLHLAFDQDTLYLLFKDDDANSTQLGSIDLRRGLAKDATSTPRLDFHKTFTVGPDGYISMDNYYYQLIKAEPYGFKLAGSGQLNIGVDLTNATSTFRGMRMLCVGCQPGDEVIAGIKYLSAFTLTPPKISDPNGVAVTTYKATLQEFFVNWAYTGKMSYEFKDKFRTIGEKNMYPALLRSDVAKETWRPEETVRGRYPVRLEMKDIVATFATSDIYDLRPTLIEYGYRYNQVRGRRV